MEGKNVEVIFVDDRPDDKSHGGSRAQASGRDGSDFASGSAPDPVLRPGSVPDFAGPAGIIVSRRPQQPQDVATPDHHMSKGMKKVRPQSTTSDDSDLSEISSDVSSRMSPLTPSPDPASFETPFNAGTKRVFITAGAKELTSSTHAIDQMAEDQLNVRGSQPSRDTQVHFAPGEMTPIEEEGNVPIWRRLLIRLKSRPDSKKMTEDELSHMTVNNILYFMGAVFLIILLYVLYAEEFNNDKVKE